MPNDIIFEIIPSDAIGDNEKIIQSSESTIEIKTFTLNDLINERDNLQNNVNAHQSLVMSLSIKIGEIESRIAQIKLALNLE